MSLVYNNYVLVQLSDDFDLTLDSFIPLESGWIPGYEMVIFLISSFILIGFILIHNRKKIKR